MRHPRPTVERSVRPILVCDVHDSYKILDELGDRSAEFLNDMYWELGDVIGAKGGRVTKLLGDGVIALFPEGGEVAAVAAAIDMRCVFEGLLADYAISVESELETGIASGEVQLAELGHPTLRSVEVIGLPMFEAGRIGDYRGVAMTEAVFQAIGDAFPTRRIDDLPVKWSTEPLRLWEIVEPEGPSAGWR